MLTSGPVEPREALTESHSVVTDASSGAVAASLISVPVEGVRARGALSQLACWPAVASVAQAAHVLVGVPGQRVGPPCLGGEEPLWPASAVVAALIRTDGALTSHSLIANEAIAHTRLAITNALVGALSPSRSLAFTTLPTQA